MKLVVDRLTTEAGTAVDQVIVVLRPDDEDIAQWLIALKVPLGESAHILYDHLGPTKIESNTIGTWRLPETKEEAERSGVHFVNIDGRTLCKFDEQ